MASNQSEKQVETVVKPVEEEKKQKKKGLEVKATDMIPKMQIRATTLAQEVYNKSGTPSEIAAALKQAFDAEHEPMWHCIVGENFGSNVVHTSKCFIFFSLDSLSILLFKCGTG